MPRTAPNSPKKSPRNGGRYGSRGRGEIVSPSEKKSLKRKGPFKKNSKWSPRKSQKVVRLELNFSRKRKTSISSVSSVSSISATGELADSTVDAGLDDSSDSDDDEDDLPAESTPSYRNIIRRGRKAGPVTHQSPLTNGRKILRLPNDRILNDHQGSDADSSDDDDGYAAVDDISDDDEEDLDVEKLEEQMIVESEDEHRFDDIVPSLPFLSESVDWPALANLDDSVPFPAACILDEETLYSGLDTFGETDFTSEAVETPARRHVHFEESDSSPSDSDQSPSSSTDEDIPGDFLQQDSLDPIIRRMIENESETLGKESERYDDIFGELDNNQGANIYHVESDALTSDPSGYETDDGETTDEDLPPPATITHPKSILRRDSCGSLPGKSNELSNEPSVPSRRRGPIAGLFKPDPKLPVAIIDATGEVLMILPAYASARHDWLESANNSLSGTASNSPRATTMHLIDESDTDALISPTRPEPSPMLASSANLMMTALGNDTASGGQVMGPPEAFYPSRTFGGDSSGEEDDDDDDEAMLNVEDFIDFGNGSSDDEDKQFDDDDLITSPLVTSSIQGTATPTPKRCVDPTSDSNAERFLNHLDQGIVTAFRRNNNRYQTLIRLPRHREFMPANSPSRPASVFRHLRYSDPRSPVRKRKASDFAGGEAVRRRLVADSRPHTQLPF